MYILNGLGSRGVLLSPYLSYSLINYIYYKCSLDTEIDIKRFENK